MSIIGAISLIIFDFAGAYWRNYYVEGWLTISPFSSIWVAIIVILLAIALFYCASIAAKGLNNLNPVQPSQLKNCFLLSLTVFIVVIIGGIAFVIVSILEDYNSWWFDPGFYVGAISSLIGTIIFYMAYKQTNRFGGPVRAPYVQTQQYAQPPYQDLPPPPKP